MIIHCPECQKEISDKAGKCPHCGFPVARTAKQAALAERATACRARIAVAAPKIAKAVGPNRPRQRRENRGQALAKVTQKMGNLSLSFLLFVASSLFVTGCVSYVKVPYQVTSIPSGAAVEINGVLMGNTPTQLTLETRKEWVGVAFAPGGWAYGNDRYEITAYPPANANKDSYPQTKTIIPAQNARAGGGAIFFDFRRPLPPEQQILFRNR